MVDFVVEKVVCEYAEQYLCQGSEASTRSREEEQWVEVGLTTRRGGQPPPANLIPPWWVLSSVSNDCLCRCYTNRVWASVAH